MERIDLCGLCGERVVSRWDSCRHCGATRFVRSRGGGILLRLFAGMAHVAGVLVVAFGVQNAYLAITGDAGALAAGASITGAALVTTIGVTFIAGVAVLTRALSDRFEEVLWTMESESRYAR